MGFKKVLDEIVKIYKGVSLSDLDVLKLVNNKARVMLYKDLAKYQTLDEALGPHGAIFLLYESEPQYGHWTVIWRRNKDTINFFDSYGTFPDEQIWWNDKETQLKLGQSIPYLSYLLINSDYPNLEYNDYQYQKDGKDINTCGRFAALRLLLRDWSPEQFQKVFGNKNADDLVTIITELL